MASIPQREHCVRTRIDRVHENKSDPPRYHFGISTLGHPCDRWLWLTFRWAVREQFPGRMKRLFRRGQNEEFTAVSDLREAGVDVRETGRNQRRLYGGCHVEGSVDGIIMGGLPESPRKQHILEIKTHSKKSFDELVKQGVEKSKPMHFIQMQCYMRISNIDRALYFAVCKDDDQIHTERVKLDRPLAEKYLERGRRLAVTERLPEPVSADPSWYQCRMCAAHGFCHEGDHTKEVTCRTCAHSTPTHKGTWTCARWEDAEIPKHAQLEGCRAHVIHPDLVKWKLDQDKSSRWTAAWVIDGRVILNGEDGYSSWEVIIGGPFHDPVVDMARDLFDGEIINKRRDT